MRFKQKVTIYLKSGNIIYIRCEKIKYIHDGSYENKVKNIIIEKPNFILQLIDYCIEGIAVKKWWQRWG